MSHFSPNRREFLASGAAAAAAAGLSSSFNPLLAADGHGNGPAVPRGKAEHCIYIWLGGGACHIDTWDPKRKGDAKKRTPGSYYDPIDTCLPGVQVCEHLSRCAPILDRFNLVRSVHHDVIDEHAAATNRMHTGRPTSGTIVYPSLGSAVAHQRGPAGDGVPAYVVIGYPNITRGPGFLGAAASYVYLTDTKAGPAGLSRPEWITNKRQQRREDLLATLRQSYQEQNAADRALANYDETVDLSLKLAGPQFNSIFELDSEPSELREAYGGEFGQRCLLSRRLLQAGVRFIEVSHNLNFVNGTGWDTHNKGQLKQHLLIEELDKALSTLVLDLERNKMLDKTLIVVGSEFGRPAGFDGGGGRGHHADAFTVVLAGGGLNNGRVIGETDELGMNIVSQPVSVPDLFATVHNCLGIDPAETLYADTRPVPITDMGKPIPELFS